MRYYIECSYEEKDEAKKLGAMWDWEKRKWYYTNEADKPKFAKWIVDEVEKQLPDLSSRFDEDIEADKQKYFLQMGKNGKAIIEEGINPCDGYKCCYDYPLKKEWCCNGCDEWEDEFDKIYPIEKLEQMTQEEITKAEDEIIANCKVKNCDNDECECCGGYTDGGIHSYIDILPTIGAGGSKIFYLGQFISIVECRKYLSKFNL